MDLKKAEDIASSLARRLGCEQIELNCAYGRVLAENLSAGRDIPGDPLSSFKRLGNVER